MRRSSRAARPAFDQSARNGACYAAAGRAAHLCVRDFAATFRFRHAIGDSRIGALYFARANLFGSRSYGIATPQASEIGKRCWRICDAARQDA